MRQKFAVLMLLTLVVMTSTIVQARGAPQHSQPFAVEKVMNAAPVVTSIPTLVDRLRCDSKYQ